MYRLSGPGPVSYTHLSVLVARDGFDMTNLKGGVQAVYMGMRKSDDDRTDVRFYDSLEESLNGEPTAVLKRITLYAGCFAHG